MRQRDWDRLFKKSPGCGLIVFSILLLSFGIFGVGSHLESLYTFGIILIILGSALFIIGIALIVKKHIQKKEKETALLLSNIESLDSMNGIDFEEYLAALFKKEGYGVKLTKTSGDYGVDLILSKSENNDTKKIIVQAKRYHKNVSISAVQEIFAARDHYGIYKAWVVTNSYFTGPAIKLAKSNGITLIDRVALAEHINSLNNPNQENDEKEIK